MDAASVMKLRIFSNQYYEFINKFVKSDFENSKMLGKFYTDLSIAKRLITDLLSQYEFPIGSNRIRIIDPFCGDGRLIKLLLLKIADIDVFKTVSLEIVLWDIDQVAVEKAGNEIKNIIKETSLDAIVNTENVDAYVLYASEEKKFDICITNPPWCLLKPQKIFHDRCTLQEINEYKKSVALYDTYIKSEFPLSQPTRKFGKWGTNLGRTGAEVLLRLMAPKGICGLVSPASLFNDQVSVTLRKWIFDEHRIYSISYYPAELKLYGPADVSSVTAVIGTGKTDTFFTTKIFGLEHNYETKILDKDEFEYVKRNQYTLPLETGFGMFNILRHLEKLPTVLDFCTENDFTFVRELDETRVTEKLSGYGKIGFAKGYMVDRYQFQADGLFLNEEKVVPPNTIKGWKIVWRDVSRNSQKRRMKATILPPGHIVGNSLGAICNMDERKNGLLKILLAVMNSMVFEFQARSHLVSNHVSAGVIKQLHVPYLTKEKKLQKLVDNRMIGKNVEWEIEVYVAKLYALTEKQFFAIVSRFDFSNNEIIELKTIAKQYY
ncbi:Alw26I/Eco31I/Esp3I family type II restriction adenine-specific DNA-methyltransferase [Megasphaera sueciensis]|uniref:Alw26I/Eco31I/Esp3I family type II restriction adenine-specific DNA-methyltransferase n=1 Tax=Megasphaera sueciensis TaxID=349094 RepID=UPI003D048CE1